MVHNIIQTWKSYSPRVKGMFIGALIPLIAFLISNYVYSLAGLLEQKSRMLSIFIVWFINSFTLPISLVFSALAYTFIIITLALFCLVGVYGLIGFFSGWLYEVGLKRNKLLAFALALIPWILYILLISPLVGFSMFG